MDKCLSAISVDAKIDMLGSILDGKIVIDNKKCRTAKFNSVISLIVGKSDIYTGENEKRSLSFTETPLPYPMMSYFRTSFFVIYPVCGS